MNNSWRRTGAVCALFSCILLLVSASYIFSSKSGRGFIDADELNYGIVIDCGSSGSRIYVYQWPPHSGNPGDLLKIQQVKDEKGHEVVKKISPGLSSFENNPDDASEHIKKLLLYAKDYIPLEKHRETSLYVMATAGMRMLPESKQKAILADLQTDIKSEFDFVAPENHFEVISGKQEGVYAWIAINYVLDKFSHSYGGSDSDLATVTVVQPGKDGGEVFHRRKRTVGIIDMGGGSVQIAFEVTNKDQIKEIPSNLLTELNLGCQDSDTEHAYRVYVTTFLGFGANSARDRYEEMMVKHATLAGKTGSQQDPLTDVCLPKNMPSEISVSSGLFHLRGSGEYDKCEEILVPLLNTSVPCPKPPCSINGVHQPKIDPATSFYGFSEFWYSMEDVFRMGGLYDHDNFRNNALKFCSTSWQTLKGWYDKKLYPKADNHRFNYQCFKSSWMVDVFHKAFGFPNSYSKLTSAQLVRGQDVGWTLGALIYRTRFLPLRDIEKQHPSDGQAQPAMSSWRRLSRLLDTPYVFIFCFLVVVASIAFYMNFLRCCPGKSTVPRVPSMSYLMTDTDQMEQGYKQGFNS